MSHVFTVTRLLTALFVTFAVAVNLSAPVWAADKLGYTKFSGSSGPQQEGFFVADDAQSWHLLWSKVGKPAKGTFKPGQHTGVGVFLGPRPDGDRLRVRKVQNYDGRIEVMLTHKHGVSSGETIYPWVIVLVQGTGGDPVATVVDIRHAVASDRN